MCLMIRKIVLKYGLVFKNILKVDTENTKGKWNSFEFNSHHFNVTISTIN